MAKSSASIAPVEIQYQQQALSEVSRTFALTIPLLPTALEHAVGNAYLLCRIADTIEDDVQLSLDAKKTFSDQLIGLVNGDEGNTHFADQLTAQLSAQTPRAERELVARTAEVLKITQKLEPDQILAIKTCVRQMATGMPDFQHLQTGTGLTDIGTLNRYCYLVAGVVGEMLTELFCDHSEQIAQRRDRLFKLAFSFGQGLQLTNILKDIHVDKKRGICWLPQDLFRRHGFDLEQLDRPGAAHGLSEGINHLLAITRDHLDNALQYALTIPREETEIRRFLIFPIILALLTLQKIRVNSSHINSKSVKISRRSVMLSRLFIKYAVSHDNAVTGLVKMLSRNLPTATAASG